MHKPHTVTDRQRHADHQQLFWRNNFCLAFWHHTAHTHEVPRSPLKDCKAQHYKRTSHLPMLGCERSRRWNITRIAESKPCPEASNSMTWPVL
eukprot:2155653-Amphidinium_carterae.2